MSFVVVWSIVDGIQLDMRAQSENVFSSLYNLLITFLVYSVNIKKGLSNLAPFTPFTNFF